MVAGTCISRVKFEFFSVFDEATSASNWDMRVDDLAVQVPIRFRGFCICDFAFFVQGSAHSSKNFSTGLAFNIQGTTSLRVFYYSEAG